MEAGFHDAFAEALARRGVTLSWLHERLVERGCPVSPTALSYWRSGRSQPERGTSLEALAEIERLLRLSPGGLSARLGPSKRPGPRPGERSMQEIFADSPGVLPALHALEFEGLYDELVEQLRHITVDIDEHGRATGMEVRAIMQARGNDARRTPLIVTLDGLDRAPEFRPVAGCSIGRTFLDPATGVFAAELLMDRSLARDETCLYELSVELGEPSDDAWFDHYAARRLGELLIWVRFDPSRLPSRLERYVRTDDGEEVTEVTLGGGRSVHALARGFGPGMLGIRWTW
ncbi:hypothetical protein [Nocardioides cynanchi]|uniref:hypothetical protein n=1 Tax=Nocardioides cynanchi TaxID=2558918 RepID=UPI0012493A12|nr:hypothetical protein [Nocardioides cynanchi]